jgi:ATP-dependent RNA helicase DDX49/DBP8
VELVGAIESHIGHKLEEYEMDEAAVLKGITKVYNAKKAAALAAMQQEDRAAVGAAKSRSNQKKKPRNLNLPK